MAYEILIKTYPDIPVSLGIQSHCDFSLRSKSQIVAFFIFVVVVVVVFV